MSDENLARLTIVLCTIGAMTMLIKAAEAVMWLLHHIKFY